MQLDDPGVAQPFEYSDLSLCSFLLHGICQLVLVIYFHRVLVLVAFVQAQSHDSVGTLTQSPADLVILDVSPITDGRRHMARLEGGLTQDQIGVGRP